MSSPRKDENQGNNNKAATAAAPADGHGAPANNDEEAPLLIPREISFHMPHESHRTRPVGFGNSDDDNTVPSELSTLIAPSTLTPNYSPNVTHHNHYGSSSRASRSGGDDQSSVRFNKAFQLAALLGFLSIGAIFGADVVYMMVTSDSNAVSNHNHDGSHSNSVSSSHLSMDALDLGNRSRGTTGPDHQEDNEETTGDNKTSKKNKKTKAAKKNKARKEKQDEHEVDEDQEDGEEHLSTPYNKTNGLNNLEKGELEKEEDDEEEDDEEDDDELIISTNRFVTPDMLSAEVKDLDPTLIQDVPIPQAYERCPYVINTFQQQNEGVTNLDFLHEKYVAQSADPNVFYRATALLFWKDFALDARGTGAAGDGWGSNQNAAINFDDLVLLNEAKYEDGTPMSPMSTWTWITGDQHLSNFGAWRNRGGEVVFSVNDFDEAAIYDFHMDVLRIAVSICSHGFTNGLTEDEVREALEAFTYTYVKTSIGYVGGDTALVYELNRHTSTGVLRDFLWDVENKRGTSRQLHKFTEIGPNGERRFVRNGDTRLVDVPSEIEGKIRAEMTSTRYGASMMKMGWKVRGWDDDFFTVLDVARRIGSGIGSYGVDRFYVLLKGEDPLLEEDSDGPSVILDVKYEPTGAVTRILNENDPETLAWYQDMFRNEADRAGQAQQRLTSYTDPYVGYLVIDGDSYNVRQRSPYKSSFEYDQLTNHRAFVEFMEQIAIATATAHVRGTVAKSPGQFKHVIKLLLAGDRNRKRWSELVAEIALSYRQQVLLDFECFKQFVQINFPDNR